MSYGNDGTDGLTDAERKRRALGRRIGKAKAAKAKAPVKVSPEVERMLAKLRAQSGDLW